MDADLMPFSLIAKLLGGLALCFAVLVGMAWLLRKQWPSLLGAAKGARREDKGIRSLSKLEDGESVRVLVTEQRLGSTREPTLHDLSEALVVGSERSKEFSRYEGHVRS